jgi:allantoinase
MTVDLVVTGSRVVTPAGIGPAAIVVADGAIAAVVAPGDAPPARNRVDAGAAAVLPGIVDTHVHVNEPGRTEWEGFDTATRAAAAGGVTTIVDMPLNCIPATTTVAAFHAKAAAAAGVARVDYGFWGGVVPGNEADLDPLIDAGVPGFKCFLVASGVDEFPAVGRHDLERAMPRLARRDAVLLVHAELPGPIVAAPSGDPRRYDTWLGSRPPRAELEAIDLVLGLARDTGCRVHIVHLACADALPRIVTARDAGVGVTVETCPHYLTFAAEDIPDGATAFKCAPPIRERAQGDGLWAGLTSGAIDLVASDHSPAPPAVKRLDTGDFVAAWGGIASLELSLSAVWTGARRRGATLAAVTRWMAERPARLARLPRKGCIAPGYDADLVVFDPEASRRVDAHRLHQRHPVTPYAGLALDGAVRRTLVRGRTVYVDGEFPGPPAGRWLGGPG